MPYNKKNSGGYKDKQGKDFDRKRNNDGKNQDQPFKRDAYARKKGEFNASGPAPGRKPYKPKDENELAPPRFLPPLGKKKPYPSAKREESGKFGRKPTDKSFTKGTPEKRDFSRDRSKAPKTDWGEDDFATKYFDKNKKRPDSDNKFGAGNDFKRSERPARTDRTERRDTKPFNTDRSSRPERTERKDTKTFRTDKSSEPKKPFRPSYETEVKQTKFHKEKDRPTKSKNDRKKELLGIVDEPTDIRLNKYIANSGICARREADELIKKGLVTVNGKVVTEMGHKVKKEDVVTYEGRKILPEPFVYILMNKPKDFITTTDDEKGRKTVLDLVADKIPQRIYPIGRLDRNTTGVLLLTNDGEVAQALTHPAFEIKKVYHVVLDKKVSPSHLDQLVEGVTLEDGQVFADAVSYVDAEDKRQVGVEIHSGKNRVIRRMFEHLGYEVERLDRVSVGVFTKKDLPRGKWRFLNPSEVGFLMKLKSKMH
jgi:23S rRNA pseudouridine2605 synthase